MILDYGLGGAQPAPLLVGLPLLLLLAAFYYIWTTIRDRKYQVYYPLLGNKESQDLREIVQTQWRQDKERKYMLQLPFRQMFVLPSHYVNDYAWKPEPEISSNIDLRERLLGRWTLLGSMTPEAPGDRTHSAIAFIKGDMMKNMTMFFPNVHDEIKNCVNQDIGDCPEWTPRSAYWLGVDFNLRIFERVFVGLDLCRNDDWNAACMGYSTTAIATAAALMKYPWWQRPIVAPFLTQTKSLKKYIDALEDFLRPVLQARMRQMQSLDFKRPNDFIQWWVEKVDGKKRHDSYALTAALIQLNIAGIQSTGMVVMQALFDLAGRPEYVAPLRQELERVISEDGGLRELSPRSLGKLAHMDSFLKESQRHVSQNLLSIYRKVMSPLTLKDGTILPTGSYVCVPSMDPEADPRTLTRPFDGLRWARLRQDTGNDTKYLSVATGPESLEFGHGSHACPGRFFATNVIKSTLIPLLLDYDLRLPDGESRPVPKYNRILVLTPDRDRVVELRKRRGAGGGETGGE